jgi:epsilon-lactone hydrolase
MATYSHPLTPEDRRAMDAMRSMVEPNKGKLQGIAARAPFDAIMFGVAAPEGVTYRPDVIGGVPGWWCSPAGALPGPAILHLHGGWFNWGSAEAYRPLVGHIARSAGADAFVPDYRLAPEHPFPAGLNDIVACYRALIANGTRRIAITGDSAGGNLALVLLRLATTPAPTDVVRPVAAVVLSPVTDLAMTGRSWETRAAADPYFVRSQAAALIGSYLNGADPMSPSASPLYGDLTGLPPIRVQVGDDEVLLDDAARLVERAAAAGVDARLEVWQGMPHGFHGAVGHLTAATQALDLIGAFLSEHLNRARRQ